ncbi:MAG: amino acid ABC transporter permease [Spirochaetaceae bacterium]|jgi:polar amino acid transport system permease protein|nr:amino acid ABC transporter permease [Spirochaetaceae bacterium]
MFSLCEGHINYNSIPLYRKRWFLQSLIFWVLWFPAVIYYLPLDFLTKPYFGREFFAVVMEHRNIITGILCCIFWGVLGGILATGDVYALRKANVYKIKLKFVFTLINFIVLAAAAGGGALFGSALSRVAPKPVMDLFTKIALWTVRLLEGSRITLWLTILAVSAGLVLSLFLALGKMSKNFWINRGCSAYVFFFRGTPLLMQLYFIYYGLPQIAQALTINDRFLAAFIAFSLNSAAYCAEIIRAAILSIDRGQFEAAKALRMSYGQTMSLIIIPQSIRRLIPPVGNEFIMMLKDASLVSIIALTDITKVTRSISSSTASAMVYIPAMILYLIITAIFTFVFHKLESKYSVYV